MSLNNTFRRRTLHSFPDKERISNAAFEIQSKLTKQSEDLTNLQGTILTLKYGTSKLRDTIIKASTELGSYNNEQLALRHNISQMERDLNQLKDHSGDL